MRRYLCVAGVLAALCFVGNSTARAAPECGDPLPDIFQRVSPSVVFVSAVMIDPFKLSDRLSTSIGSGFIIDDEGLILTNSHVVYGSRSITVTLDGGHVVRAKLVGDDSLLDLAVLRIPKPSSGLPALTLGDSAKMKVGEDVLAIGNPFGLKQTLTVGVVSGVNRILPVLPMNMKLPLIQTDAAINLGNSGGPLINRCGEVIGITTAFVGEDGNLGFSIPINVVKEVLPQLVAEGRVIRPWVGVAGQLIGKELGEIINLPLVDGFLVETVESGSPAELAGLRGGRLPVSIAGKELYLGGDIVTKANGVPLNDPKNFLDFVRSLHVGDEVHLTIFREGTTREVVLQLPERPN
jgi:S1-C subfamily serine protease